MPKINLCHKTELSPNEAFERIKTALPDDENLKSLDSSYRCQFDSEKHVGKIEGSRFKADVTVHGTTPTEVKIHIEIPLIVVPFKSMIEQTLSKKFNQLLG